MRHFAGRPDRHRELADALDLAFELVAGNGGGDARGRAGHDDVAGRELDHLGKLHDHLRHVPDHLREIAVLADLAVALERDRPLLGWPILRRAAAVRTARRRRTPCRPPTGA